MSDDDKKPEDKKHRCILEFWQRGVRADLREQRHKRDRYSRPTFYCPELELTYAFDGLSTTDGKPTCGLVLVSADCVSVWRGETPQA